MHLSFKSVCNKEYKGVICNMTSSRYSSKSTRTRLGKNYSSFLDFTRNYERMSKIFVLCKHKDCLFRYDLNTSMVGTGADHQNITDHEDVLINGKKAFCERQYLYVLTLQAPRKKMHLKLSSAEVVCCK